MLALGNVTPLAAIDELRLEHDDRVGVANCGSEQAFCVGRIRRDRDLHTRRVHVVGLGRVVVELGRAWLDLPREGTPGRIVRVLLTLRDVPRGARLVPVYLDEAAPPPVRQ